MFVAMGFQSPKIQAWERIPSPGLLFRMEVETDPKRTIYALRIDPRKLRMESRLAGDGIYEPGKYNGRATVTEMTDGFGALAGINGDFFQFTPDPGGDPLGLAVHAGKLLSAPGAGTRNVSVGWGSSVPFEIVKPRYSLKIQVGSETITPEMFNGKVPKAGLGLSFDVAGDIYGEEPLTAVKLGLPNGQPDLGGTIQAVVQSVQLEVKRTPVPKGCAVLAASGDRAKTLAGLKVGDKITINLELTGIPKGITEVMGGWPILLRDGKYVGPKQDEKSAKHPRSVIGVTADKKIWQVVIDGRQSMSGGTNFVETADIMRRLGCVEAINLDGGGSSAIRFLGLTVNRPSGGVERAVANGIFTFGDRPKVGAPFVIGGGEEVQVGGTIMLTATSGGKLVPAEKVIWSAQGGAWIDQDGLLRAVKTGSSKVAALVDGRVVTKTITVKDKQ